MNLKGYIQQVSRQWQTDDATEHSYRGMLGQYIQSIIGNSFVVVNEPSHIECGAPDYVVIRTSDNEPVFYIEAKDIGDNDIDGRKVHREQFDRYKGALEHIVFTDYLDFHFYERGEWTRNIRIGEIQGNRIGPKKDAEAEFEGQIKQWSQAQVESITSAVRLAKIMASKAQLLRHVTERTMCLITNDPDDYQDSQLLQLFNAFRGLLVSDLTVKGFADMYAQTIVYGLFAARLHDETPGNFTREEAVQLIPKSNPFLRRIFNNIAGIDLDERVGWIVDDLVETFAATNVSKVMKDYGKNERRNDPMVHFYEDFLTNYDQKLRKEMGVWYTPKPIVSFIVRSIHEMLKSLFHIPQGLADTSKLTIKTKRGKREVHRIQILDIATGTATFLAEVITVIYKTICQNNAGTWDTYVDDGLKPRLNGFEIMMAPYTIAHLKLDMILRETGYNESNNNRRLNVFLTNSLEPPSVEPRTFFNAISMEAEEADKVKRDKPVMVVIGNPPYNGASTNKGDWIMKLMETYKTEPGGHVKLKERNPKWLNDDYVKFIRLAENYVEKNGKGIIGFINPHGFIDNPTFRGMRWNLLKTFDRIYILNLHGNSKKREVCPDGSKDENVFDIMQGVSINIFVKTGKDDGDELGKVYYAELWGLRENKFKFLESHDATDVEYKEVIPQNPMFFFNPMKEMGKEDYDKGFSIPELFVVNSVGVVTTKDSFLVCDDIETLKRRINDLISMPDIDFFQKYKLKDTRDWMLSKAKLDVGISLNKDNIIEYDYRPFDKRYIYYTGTTNGLIARPRAVVQRNMLHVGNLGLLTCRQCVNIEWNLVGVTENVVDDCRLSNKTKERGYIFPLYVYQNIMGTVEKVPNLNPNMHNRIADSLGFKPTPEQLFYYIYAVLHSTTYREKYKEFLKRDFPRIPYPTDSPLFEQLTNLGKQLVELHLMHDAESWNVTAGFPKNGSNVVDRYDYSEEKVWINEQQYFSNVSETAWTAFIGGYQPAQKWLKDRRGRELTYEDIIHYERIVYVLDTTKTIVSKIDGISQQ